jgi:hypothetical protein
MSRRSIKINHCAFAQIARAIRAIYSIVKAIGSMSYLIYLKIKPTFFIAKCLRGSLKKKTIMLKILISSVRTLRIIMKTIRRR